MTWVFSEGRAFSDDVREFTARIGMSWREVEDSLNNEGGTTRLIKGIEQASSSLGSQVFAWFEVGRNTLFLSNMAGTGAPASLVHAAMSGYRRYLEDAQVRVEERDRLQTLLIGMANGSLEEKTLALRLLRERLRDQALAQDEREKQMQEPSRPTVLNGSEQPETHLILLVHGIRDIGRWQSEVRLPLEQRGFTVELTNYDRMNLLEFLAPVSSFRNRAKGKVLTQIRSAIAMHPNHRVSIIAHSFGTYVVSEVLREAFDLKFHRIIFCGSVVAYDFPFEQFQGRFTKPVLNDVGTNDPWPAVAESVTFGYGSAGTYGFRVPGVRDRFYNGGGHDHFLNAAHCTTNWIPFLLGSREFPLGNENAVPPPLWVRFISIFKIKYLLFLLVILLGLVAAGQRVWSPTEYSYTFNASGSKFTYWNAPVQQLLRDVSNPCPGPAWVCGSPWLTGRLFKRRFVTVQVSDNDITRIVSCQPFNYPPDNSSASVTYDPLNALHALVKSFPQCLSFTESLHTGAVVLGLKREGLVEARQSGERRLLCGCPTEAAASFN